MLENCCVRADRECCVRSESDEVPEESLQPSRAHPSDDAVHNDRMPVATSQQTQSSPGDAKDRSGKSVFFQVELMKTASNDFGIDVDWGDGRTLRVTKVKDSGMVAKWNREHDEVFCVQEGDTITQVNGATGNSLDLLKAFLHVSKFNGKKRHTRISNTFIWSLPN